MTKILDSSSLETIDTSNLALCLGFFDGLHKGHQLVISEALKHTDNVGVLTFETNIKESLSKRESGMLTSITDRQEILSNLKVNYLIVMPFTDKIKNSTPEEFIVSLVERYKPSYIVTGLDFHFGKNAIGDTKLLKKLGEKYHYQSIAIDLYNSIDGKISTSQIIRDIKDGKVAKANEELGRPYAIKGQVVHGLSNGRRLGYKTANIKPDIDYVIPKNGVYATIAIVNGVRHLSMTNIGYHPTLDKLSTLAIETHIFNLEEDLYGKEVKVEFLDMIRDEIKFETISDLINQLASDKKYIIDNYNI